MKKPEPATDDHAVASRALQDEARMWLRRLTSGSATQWDAQAFKRWQHSSPAHQQALDEAKRQWQMLPPVIGDLLRSDPQAAAFHERSLRKPRMGRRAFLGAAAGMASAAVAAVIYPPLGLWPALSEWDAEYRTATGEQRELQLADRVSVTLNTQTSARRQLTGNDTTGLELIAGEAAIDVANTGRGFSISAGNGRSVADSGRFEVRRREHKVCVTCIAGSVRVEHPAGSRVLQARQQTVYDAAAISGIAAIDTTVVSAWRRGQLIFQQTPLAQVLEEINRYRAGRVVLLADAVRGSAVSGRFAIAELDAALLQIQHSFDLHARTLPGGVLILS